MLCLSFQGQRYDELQVIFLTERQLVEAGAARLEANAISLVAQL